MSEFAQTDQALYAHFMNGDHFAQGVIAFIEQVFRHKTRKGCMALSMHIIAEVNRAMQDLTSERQKDS